MSDFLCPICREPLFLQGRSLCCEKRHSFDLARQGYVNLVTGGGTRHAHGDDRAMVRARTAFLSLGHYDVLCDALSRLVVEQSPELAVLLDAGCGEGYYTCRVKDALGQAGKRARVIGIDLSREALIAFSRRDKEASLAVASIADLPVESESVDVLLNLFAPQADAEFLRVLKRGGKLFCVFPLEDHLFGLKERVYENPYLNPNPEYAPQGFRLICREDVHANLHLTSAEEIQNLFLMTPYYYKTSRRDQEKLSALKELITPISFGIFVFEKE
jgi:23S rRNA (guanine745-N1)-methyltransferase